MFRLEPTRLVVTQEDGTEVSLITTSTQLVDERLLERRDTCEETDNEVAVAVEYLLDGEVVHRSAHVMLKTSPQMAATQGGIG